MIEMIIKISNVILPIFILMGIGAVCYYRKTLDTRTNNQLKSLTYNFTMPVMLFYFMTKTDGQIISYSYVFLIVAYCIIVTGIAFLINHKYFTKNNKETAIASLSWIFSNSAYIGLPMSFLAFGQKGLEPAIIITVVYTIVFLFLTLFLSNIDDLIKSKKILMSFIMGLSKKIFLSPIIFGPILGLIFAIYQIKLPQFIDYSLSLVANTNMGLALIVIGFSIVSILNEQNKKSMKVLWREIICLNSFKLILCPLVAFLIIYSFDFNIIWKSVFILQSSLATGLISYIVASNAKVYEGRCAFAILSSTIFSLVTLPILIGLLFAWN
ncbi:MAG: AEC family transporter [Alphaproteobacteria bacterium]|nr:AEC family transporter [Alphaproteobacteria bacterium]